MNSISTKIRIALLVGIATLVGIVLYVKADRTAEDESIDSSYTVKSSPTTNLNAIMNAHPRANEYTSSEYASKMAPNTTQASEYLALYESLKAEDYSFQDNTGGYKRKTAPSTHQGKVLDKGTKKIEGQRAVQSNSDAYESFGVRSAIVRNDTIVEQAEWEEDDDDEYEEEDPRLQIATDVKQRVVGVDSYSRALKNAETNDDAYQTNGNQQTVNPYGRYKVRSADRDKASYASTIEDDNYARKSAPQGIVNDSQSVKQYAQDKNTNNTYEGYAVKSVSENKANIVSSTTSLATTDGYARRRAPQSIGESVTSLAQYDNAKGNDKAYQANNTSQEGETYGGYAVRSSNKKSIPENIVSKNEYTIKRAPQGSNPTPVRDYANTTKARKSETEYGGYAVRSVDRKDIKTAQNESDSKTYGGYAVRSSGGKSVTKDVATTNESGYARRRAPLVAGQRSTNLAQYDNASQNDVAYKAGPNSSQEETYEGYAVRSAKTKSNSSSSNSSHEYAQKESEETYEGYAVRSAGRKNIQPTNNTLTKNSSRAKGGVPASSGLKMYGSRGERLALNTPQTDRSVIVMPKRGRSAAGTVVQDDPGISIIIQSNAGAQLTYRYGEIDALVNL